MFKAINKLLPKGYTFKSLEFPYIISTCRGSDPLSLLIKALVIESKRKQQSIDIIVKEIACKITNRERWNVSKPPTINSKNIEEQEGYFFLWFVVHLLQVLNCPSILTYDEKMRYHDKLTINPHPPTESLFQYSKPTKMNQSIIGKVCYKVGVLEGSFKDVFEIENIISNINSISLPEFPIPPEFEEKIFFAVDGICDHVNNRLKTHISQLLSCQNLQDLYNQLVHLSSLSFEILAAIKYSDTNTDHSEMINQLATITQILINYNQKEENRVLLQSYMEEALHHFSSTWETLKIYDFKSPPQFIQLGSSKVTHSKNITYSHIPKCYLSPGSWYTQTELAPQNSEFSNHMRFETKTEIVFFTQETHSKTAISDNNINPTAALSSNLKMEEKFQINYSIIQNQQGKSLTSETMKRAINSTYFAKPPMDIEENVEKNIKGGIPINLEDIEIASVSTDISELMKGKTVEDLLELLYFLTKNAIPMKDGKLKLSEGRIASKILE
jgi:hypothetical protein